MCINGVKEYSNDYNN